MQVRNTDIPERMQLREVPITAVPEGSDELEEEAEWIYKQVFCKATTSKQARKFFSKICSQFMLIISFFYDEN